jgi:Methyltransferase domain
VQRVAQLDTSLFRHVGTLAYEHDLRSLLALQEAVAEAQPGYSYLEIGSFQGGTLQSHLVDPRCRRVVAIDARLKMHLGADVDNTNTTEYMLEGLGRIEGADMSKLETIEADASKIDPESLDVVPDLCLIDGLHTDAAVVADFALCRALAGDGCVFVFHDSDVIYEGFERIVAGLEDDGVPFRAYPLPEILFVLEIGDLAVHRHKAVLGRLTRGDVPFLRATRAHKRYRDYVNRPVLRAIRSAKRTIRHGRPTSGRW